jgi:hypothetical protein
MEEVGIQGLFEQSGFFNHPMHQMASVNFSDPSYWQQRYATVSDDYNWYAIEFDDFCRDCLAPLEAVLASTRSSQQLSMLIVGCGNSSWGVSIAERNIADGSKRWNVINSDFDSTVIELMSKSYSHHRWDANVDATNFSQFADRTFDCVFDKATFDALVVSHATRPPQVVAAEMASAAYRILSTGGVWIIISNHSFSSFREFGLVQGDHHICGTNFAFRWRNSDAICFRQRTDSAPFVYEFEKLNLLL